MKNYRLKTLAVLVASICSAPSLAVAENRAEVLETGTVEVISTTPLPSVGTTLDQVPANVQAASAKQIATQHALEMTEYMNANLGSVTITEGQSNVYMPDVNFRGFTASPLAGAPQGLSAYVDGVRINEPFGDNVHWGLIPHTAISSINLIPGSNPVFGLNTLGGAMSVHTKSGAQFPGFAAELTAGSWGRRGFSFEAGGEQGNLDWFVTGNFVGEDGWRDHSPSQVNQLFGKVGWQNETTDLDLSVAIADNNLEGIQALPISMLGNREQAYSWPDTMENTMTMVSLKGSHFLTDEKLVAGNAYYRKSRIKNFASNVNDQFDGIVDTVQGFNEQSNTDQTGYGMSLQYSDLGKLFSHENQLTVGGSLDIGHSSFESFEQEADFSPDRSTIATDVFEQETGVKTVNHYYGLYFTDTLSLTDKLHLTAAGRYNYIKIKIKDSDADGDGVFVTGSTSPEVEHSFSRLNPAIGLNYNPSQSLMLYGSYNEGMRAPTPIELACADPAQPCRLPTDFLADPPLKKIVAKTWEGGLRGHLAQSWQWNASAFYSTLNDDIQFISASSAGNLGYFDNVGKTRRKGVELGAQGKLDKLTLSANYTWMRATFESSMVFHSPSNSSADLVSGDIQVNPGDRMPGIPEHALKLRAAYDFTPDFTVGMNMMAFGGVYARGDENNQDEHGKIPGYAVFNLDANWKFHSNWSAFAKVTNLFDKDYETMGILGENTFTGAGNTFDTTLSWQDEQFRSPGAPRAAWVGIRYAFGGAKSGTKADLDD